MDQHSIQQVATAHPHARMDFTNAMIEVQANMPDNVEVIWFEIYRSFEHTAALYKLGRTVVNPDGKSKSKPMGNIVSWAKAGESWHDWGLAGDIAMFTNGKPDYVVGPNWMKVVEIMKKHGFTWGGDFPKQPVDETDPPHFEKKYGQSLNGLMAMRNAGKFIPGTEYIDFIKK